MAGAREHGAGGHREARRVRSGKQLFGIRARVGREARPERIRGGNFSACGRDIAVALGYVADPFDVCGANDLILCHIRPDPRLLREGCGLFELPCPGRDDGQGGCGRDKRCGDP